MLVLSLPGQGKDIRILAIGNSFSEDAIEQYLYELALEGGDNLIIGNAYRGRSEERRVGKECLSGWPRVRIPLECGC